MTEAWNCKLCNQANALDAEKCVTCGRKRDWKPHVLEIPSKPQFPEIPSRPMGEVALPRKDLPPTPPKDIDSCAVAPVKAGSAVSVHPVNGSSGFYALLFSNPWKTVQLIAAILAFASTCFISSRERAIAHVLGCSLICFITLWPLRFLRRDEQLRIQNLVEITVMNGPGLKFINPLKPSMIVKAETLGMLEYVQLRNTLDGSERVAQGPQLLFLDPYEQVQSRGQGISLTSVQYVLIEDTRTGERRVQRGPLMWTPGPREEGKIRNGVKLNSTEYVIIQDTLTGARRVDRGPRMWFPGPYEDWEQHSGIILSNKEYVSVRNKLTGESRVDRGPGTWFPGPDDDWQQGTSINLSRTQYITVKDSLTGQSRIVRGPCHWFPGPQDSPSAIAEAIVLQEDEFVKLKDLATGARWVQSGQTLLFLEPTWIIESRSARNTGIQKSWALKGREYLRLQIGPRLRMRRTSHDDRGHG